MTAALLTLPFHRTYRRVRSAAGHDADYSSWAYILDREYARDPEHYVRAYLLIQNDLQSIFEFIEPSAEGKKAYSYRLHALLMRTCIEIEANFKAILDENKFTSPNRSLNMRDYRKVDASHHLSSYQVMLPTWNGKPLTLKPFTEWKKLRGKASPQGGAPGLPWYQAYNASKHDRHEKFKEANLLNVITAVAGLLALISSQFADQDFSAGAVGLSVSGYDYHPMEPAIGSLFRISYPNDWRDAELYDFNWQTLTNQPNRFAKFDYDAVPT